MGWWVSTISHTHEKTTVGLSHFAVDCLNFSFLGSLFEFGHHVSCCKRYRPANRGGGERGVCGKQMFNLFDTAFPLSGPYNPGSHCCFGCARVQAAHPLSYTPAQNCSHFWQKAMLIWSLRLDFGRTHRNFASRSIWSLRSGFRSLHVNYAPRGASADLRPRSLRPDFRSPHVNYAPRGASADLRPRSLRPDFRSLHVNYAPRSASADLRPRSLRPDFRSLHVNYAPRGASADLRPRTEVLVLETDESNGDIGEDDDDEIIGEEYRNNQEENEYYEKPVDFGEVERVYKVVEELYVSDQNIEVALDQCGVNLCHTLVYHVLSRFSNARKPAFRFFRWAGQQVGFSHNSLTYNLMMSILGRAKQFMSMCELLDEMCKNGSVLTIETFKIAIKAFAAGRETKKAMQMLTLMKRYDFGANIDNFNFLLDALGRAKLVKEAQMLFETMRERFPPDAKTYTVLLSGWCKVRNLIEVGKLWNEMVDGGFKPDLATHNIVLKGLFEGRRTREAVKLFVLMKTSGPSPNAMSYTIVISALCKLKKMDGALQFFVEMQENGCPLDGTLYTCLITGYGTAKELDRAYELLQEMKDNGISPDSRTYNALIKVMVNLRKPDEATKLFDEMMQCGFEPSTHTYNMLMKSYFSTKKFEMGFTLWNQMAENGCSPDVNSYTVFIGGLIREGRSQEACTYIESMIEKGMKAPHFDYNKFLADFSRAGRPDIFEELAQKMKYAGKLGIANMFIKFSQKTKRRFKRRGITPIGPLL